MAEETQKTEEIGVLAHLKAEFKEWYEDGEREAHEIVEWLSERIDPQAAAVTPPVATGASTTAAGEPAAV